MKTCTKCGKQFPDNLNSCPDDGAPLALAAAPGQAPSSTLAIVSLILGIISVCLCGPFTGIAAVICGHIAVDRAKKLPAEYSGRGLAIGGLITGYFGSTIMCFAILAGLFLPALAKAKQKAQQIQCSNNLKQIGLAVRIWSGNHNNTLPQSFLDLTNELGDPGVLICPADPDHTRSPAGAPFVWSTNNISYIFITPGVNADTVTGQVIIRCPIHGNEVMSDGSVHLGTLRPRTQP